MYTLYDYGKFPEARPDIGWGQKKKMLSDFLEWRHFKEERLVT